MSTFFYEFYVRANYLTLMGNPYIPISTMVSIFRRKGAETEWTKIVIDDESISGRFGIHLDADEKVVIQTVTDSDHIVLISNKRIFNISHHDNSIIELSSISACEQDVSLNYRLGARSKSEFSAIALKSDDKNLSLRVERGMPYWGILSMLKWIITRLS